MITRGINLHFILLQEHSQSYSYPTMEPSTINDTFKSHPSVKTEPTSVPGNQPRPRAPTTKENRAQAVRRRTPQPQTAEKAAAGAKKVRAPRPLGQIVSDSDDDELLADLKHHRASLQGLKRGSVSAVSKHGKPN